MSDVDERSEQVEQRPGDNDVIIDDDKRVQYQLSEPDACYTHRIENIDAQHGGVRQMTTANVTGLYSAYQLVHIYRKIHGTIRTYLAWLLRYCVSKM